MDRIVLDAATVAKLGGLRVAVELVDESGAVLGECRSAGPSPEIRDMARRPFAPGTWAPFTDEEIRASLDDLANGVPGITTAELLAKLRAL